MNNREYENQVARYKELIEIHGDQTDWNILRYNGILYPDEAIIILNMSQKCYVSDKFLELYISNWLRTKIDKHYFEDLFHAIKILKCVDNALLKLNLVVITKPLLTNNDDIIIAMRGEPRQKIKNYLKSKRKFFNIDTIYAMLKNFSRLYNSEQLLLSWLGYLIIRKMVEIDMNNEYDILKYLD